MPRYCLLTFVALSLALLAQDAKLPLGVIELSFQTQAYKGKYSPRHVLAAWVVDAKDQHVRTLAIYGKKQAKRLGRWRKATGKKKPDAVTGATLRKHKPLTIVWDGTDKNGKPAPDGNYKIRLEYTETNRSGPTCQVEVKKGGTPGTRKVEGNKFFADVTVRQVGEKQAEKN